MVEDEIACGLCHAKNSGGEDQEAIVEQPVDVNSVLFPHGNSAFGVKEGSKHGTRRLAPTKFLLEPFHIYL